MSQHADEHYGKDRGLARPLNRLSASTVKTASDPGLLADGNGLYLSISATGTKSWIYRFMLHGKSRDMGLGPVHTITLAEARLRAAEYRKQVYDGIDPIIARRQDRIQQALDANKAVTFFQAVEEYLEARQGTWKNPKHVQQIQRHLRQIAGDVLGNLPVQMVDTNQVMKVLQDLWRERTETASKVRGRIEAVLDYAKVRGYRTGDNPARWKGHLDQVLPRTSTITTVQHMPSMPYADMPAFINQLREQPGASAVALEFLILTAARTGEALGARWCEIDVKAGHWTVPAIRMKAKKEHRVPLSDAALTVLERARPKIEKQGEFIFPGGRAGKPLSDMALTETLRRMDLKGITVHGFRSTFRTWAGEETHFSREVIETALAHVVGNKVENAYWRGDLYDKRQKLMVEWARYLQTE